MGDASENRDALIVPGLGDASDNRDALLCPFRNGDTVDPQDDISLAAKEREPRVGLSCRNHSPQYRSSDCPG